MLSIIFLISCQPTQSNEENRAHGARAQQAKHLALPVMSAASLPKDQAMKPITPVPHGIINNGPRSEPKVALTFDADMTTKMLKDLETGKIKTLYDKKIAEILEQNSVPATIFITGLWAQKYSDEVKAFAQNPLYEIANHSWDHSAFSGECYSLPKAKDKDDEIVAAQKILTDLTGKTPKFFRFPGGCHSDSDVLLVEKHGLRAVDWDAISGDAFLKDPQKIISEIMRKTTNGSIIVMHLNGAPNAPATATALPKIISALTEKGFKFVTLSELLDQP